MVVAVFSDDSSLSDPDKERRGRRGRHWVRAHGHPLINHQNHIKTLLTGDPPTSLRMLLSFGGDTSWLCIMFNLAPARVEEEVDLLSIRVAWARHAKGVARAKIVDVFLHRGCYVYTMCFGGRRMEAVGASRGRCVVVPQQSERGVGALPRASAIVVLGNVVCIVVSRERVAASDRLPNEPAQSGFWVALRRQTGAAPRPIVLSPSSPLRGGGIVGQRLHFPSPSYLPLALRSSLGCAAEVKTGLLFFFERPKRRAVATL